MKIPMMKRLLVILLAICTLMTQGNLLAFAAENENNVAQSETTTQVRETVENQTSSPNKERAKVESKFVRVDKQTNTGAYTSVAVSQNDSYETVLINAVSAFKQAILAGAQKGESETSVTFTFETKDSYTEMFDYLTSYLWYTSDWEPEMGLLEMALYNEAELRPYMEYGSVEHHFVSASTDDEALKFTLYWPILYNQTVENHVSVTRSDGKVTKREFVVLEDALDAMDEWNALYGSDVDYTVEFLDICSSLIAPDRTEFPKANNINFIGTEMFEEISEVMSTGVQYSLFVASDLKANGNISISVMDITAGMIYYVDDLFTWDLGGNTLSNYGFTGFDANIVNGDLFLSKDDSEFINPEQNRSFRVFGQVDIGTVRADKGYLELDGCFDSKIEFLDDVVMVQVYGPEGSTLEIGTKKNTALSVLPEIDLTIGNIIEDMASYATLEIGHPERGHYPKITGVVSDSEGNPLPLQITFDDNMYTYGYDDTYYYGLNFDKDWILLDAPQVDEVYFTLEHTIYDETLCGRGLVVKGRLSQNTEGQYYLKSQMTWSGLNQTNWMELGKEYEASIQVYQDDVLVDPSKVTTSFYAYADDQNYFEIEKNGNHYTYLCDTFGYYTDLELSIEIDQEEGITSWRFPIYVYAQKEVDSITIPQEKLTHIEGVGDVYLMVMNGLIYNVAHEGITPNVVSDAEYFVRYTSSNEDVLTPEYATGELYAYSDGLCEIIAKSGNKSVTYTALVGQRTIHAEILFGEEFVSDYVYWPMEKGQQMQADIFVTKNSLEDKYGYGLVWESTDESVIKVDANGVLSAVGVGEATLKLTVTCLDGTIMTNDIRIVVEEGLIQNGWNQAEDGNWYYYKNGEVDTTVNGLAYNAERDEWWYAVNGKADFTYTGLTLYYGTWYYVENGVLNWNYTGLTCYYDTWYYVEGGILNWGYTGLTCYYGTWYYVENGILNWGYTGLTCYYDTWYYVENGILNWDYAGLTCYFDTWYYVEGGVLNWNYTGLTYYYGTWYYVGNGVLDWSFTGTVWYNGILWYVENGVLVGVA